MTVKLAAEKDPPLRWVSRKIIDRLFPVERDINGKPAAERLTIRHELSPPIVAELEAWMHERRSRLARHDAVVMVIAYLQNNWASFATLFADGRMCLWRPARGDDAQPLRYGSAKRRYPVARFTDVLARIADIPRTASMKSFCGRKQVGGKTPI